MLDVGRRELRRCLCISIRVQHGASGVEIVRITFGNYHVEPKRDCGSLILKGILHI